MLVSVIIPIYKVEKYLNECIKSVVNQTYRDLEIILVDDGSPDSSIEIAKAWKKKDSRIKLIQQSNGGLSVARNTGLNNAHGEWIAFIDSDDYVAEDYIEKMLLVAKSENVMLVNCSYVEVDENTRKLVSPNFHLSPGVYNYRQFWDYYYSVDMPIALITAWSKLYHKSIFKNLRYKKDILNEDEQIIYSVVKTANKVAIIDDQLYYYRTNRNGSIMNQLTNKLTSMRYMIFEKRVNDFISDGLYYSAAKCNEELLFIAMNDYVLSMNKRNRIIFIKVIKIVKKNNSILRKRGIRLSKKAHIVINFPDVVSLFKKVKLKIK